MSHGSLRWARRRPRPDSPSRGPPAPPTGARLGTVALAQRGISETPVMRSHRYAHLRPTPTSAFAGYRFPTEVITLAVRWYLRFGLSYRDVEELLAERASRSTT